MLSFFLPWKSPSFYSETEVCQVQLFLKNEEFRELKGTDSGPLFLISGKLRADWTKREESALYIHFSAVS